MVTLLVLALISFIFMDGKSSLFGGNTNKTIGKVNGSAIKQDEFQKRVSAFEFAYKGNPQATSQAINNAAWQTLVDEKTMDSELSKFDDGIDNKTLSDIAIGKYGMPSQLITQLFKTAFGEQILNADGPMKGQLNTQQAEAALKQVRSQKNGNEDAAKFLQAFDNLLPLAKNEYLSNKYNSIIQTTNYIPKWYANKKMTEDNQLANISFVTVPYTEVNDSTVAEVKVSDKDIQEYVARYRLYNF
jgi:peptidyl-prolyl cis-trans isomerase D